MFKIVCVTAVVVLVAGFCLAQGVSPTGDQFEVNSHTTDEQKIADLAVDGSGAFVVVWESLDSPGSDTSNSSVIARRFDSGGLPVGTDFQVNTTVSGYQIAPKVAMRSTGEFVVVWGSSTSAGGDTFYSIQGQRFDPDGLPLGGEVQINTLTTNVQESPAIAMAGDGDFLVVWQSTGSFGPDNDGRSIQGRLFASDGTPGGVEFQINTYSGSDQADPAVAAEPVTDGDFTVTWFNAAGNGGADTLGRCVQGQVVDADGVLLGSEFQVNTYTTGHQYNPSVAVDGGGNFIIAWAGAGSFSTDDDFSVLGQRYDRDGLVVGSEFQVNAYTTDTQCMPSVAYVENGEFVVVWRSGDYAGGGPDGDKFSVAGQAFGADGSVEGAEFVVNDFTSGRQWIPDISAAPSQRYIVAWQSEGSPGKDVDLSIQAREFAASNLFADGFESGDTAAWTTP